MSKLPTRWEFHRFVVDQVKWLKPFPTHSKARRVLFLSERGEICRAQLFPFFLYSRELAEQSRLAVRELPLKYFLNGHNPYDTDVDAVCLQTWFDLTAGALTGLVHRITDTWPNARLAYLDWFAPLDLRYAEALSPHVAAYVKKQVFRDFRQYDAATRGDTNLTDYYAERYGLDLPETRFAVPSEFSNKLVLGSGFEHSPAIRRLVRRPPSLGNRKIDLHARVAARGSEWYTRMRDEAEEKVAALDARFKTTRNGRVSYARYIDELRNSKLCLSPFGYGEICWRDFEAMSTGALLMKPDVSHLRTASDLFRPHETYVPLRWDLSDLEEKVAHYVHNNSERARIARSAYDSLAGLYRRRQFLTDVKPLLELLHIDENA